MEIYIGTVSKVDYKQACVCVAFRKERDYDAREQFETDWLPVVQPATHKDGYYVMPDKGAIVACLMDIRCERGIVLGSIYDNTNTPPSSSGEHKSVVAFDDGTTIIYDRQAKKLAIDAVGDIVMQASGSVEISGTASVTIDSDATVHLSSSGTMTIESTGTLSIDANVATINAKSGTAALLDTFTGSPRHLFVP